MPEPGKDMLRHADVAMWEAPPVQKTESGLVEPKVYLLNATPDPLGALAATVRMFGGKPTYDLADVTDEERRWAWEEALKTHLKASMEFIDLHFFIEGVTRSFTHQMVRQRTAVYVQESLRFAVKRGLAQEQQLPPTIMNHIGYSGAEGPAKIWEDTVRAVEKAYEQLIDAGIPAEDARGLLPHCVATRLHYKTNLRNFIEQAGNRLCTQAQFEWRKVWWGFLSAMRGRGGAGYYFTTEDNRGKPDGWQWQLIAQPRPETFAPVCYQMGRCKFMGELDRHCSIRDRVEAFARNNVHARHWGNGAHTDREDIKPIDPAEWMADHTAARLAPEDV